MEIKLDGVDKIPYYIFSNGGEKMKRVDLLRKLTEAGFTFKEGGRHTLVYKENALITEVPRHKEIEERLAKKILKDAGIK